MNAMPCSIEEDIEPNDFEPLMRQNYRMTRGLFLRRR
jgi:hypothetical protein